MTFSHRANWKPQINRLTLARQKRGGDILDLTQSNPTQAGIDYPLDELTDILGRAARARYDPQPLGLPEARQAVAQQVRGDAEDIVITASTSEAYSFLFKLLCDAGDEVVIATPSYPLLEHLAALEMVTLRSFALEFHRRWQVEESRVREAVTARTRALVMVNPNNPTGSFVLPEEQQTLARMSRPIISDEVFLDYAVEGGGRTFVRDDVLNFALGGLSKSAGLPHFKLGWIRLAGPPAAKRDARDALELIADNYLSVATPVQAALPELLRIAPRVRASICARVRRNLAALDTALQSTPAVRRLPVEGGWSAVLRLPRTQSDEDFAVRLVEEHGVLVHPGYFFDFDAEGYVVISLITEPMTFDEGLRRLLT